jgi:hypothetical protein
MINPIKYEKVYCKINGQELYFKGIKFTVKVDIKRVTHSGSYDAVGYITGDRTIDFTLNEPKDTHMIDLLRDLWMANHQMFNLVILAENVRNGKLEPIVMLEGCTLNSTEGNIGGKEEWKPTAGGMALKCYRINYQFDTETGVDKPVRELINGMDTMSANAKGFLNLGSNIGDTLKRFTS